MIKGIAIFDFDGTISCKDSFLDFIRFTDGNSALLRCVIKNLPYIFMFYLGLYSGHRLKEHFFSYFYKGRKQADLEKKGVEYCQTRIRQIIYPEALEVISWHQSQNHRLFLLTASSSIWLKAWCEQYGFVMLGTDFQVTEGIYTGKIAGLNCHGKEKLSRLKEIEKFEETTETYGYGDSISDKYFLSAVNKPFRVPLNTKNIRKLRYL